MIIHERKDFQTRDPAQILFQCRQRRLASQRSPGVLVGTQEFYLLTLMTEDYRAQAWRQELRMVSPEPRNPVPGTRLDQFLGSRPIEIQHFQTIS